MYGLLRIRFCVSEAKLPAGRINITAETAADRGVDAALLQPVAECLRIFAPDRGQSRFRYLIQQDEIYVADSVHTAFEKGSERIGLRE